MNELKMNLNHMPSLEGMILKYLFLLKYLNQ